MVADLAMLCAQRPENGQKANMAIAKRDGNKVFLLLQGVTSSLACAGKHILSTTKIKQASAKTGL
ncbi:hypothetical protein [Thalassospira sp. TSL5-1]|uniref:hypothetical protein n=1 Tax=Thalassospira sp. TSL5-1 TaxID=1544451 RepID=UPI00093E2C0D|nr:hypothetical protein [Thalassospira sp. TSL5-1]OKH89246.1 hypothetical protein LF95_04290 [Thalassospira sp. TSL5-1]